MHLCRHFLDYSCYKRLLGRSSQEDSLGDCVLKDHLGDPILVIVLKMAIWYLVGTRPSGIWCKKGHLHDHDKNRSSCRTWPLISFAMQAVDSSHRMHGRNRYFQNQPNFKALAQTYPEFAKHVKKDAQVCSAVRFPQNLCECTHRPIVLDLLQLCIRKCTTSCVWSHVIRALRAPVLFDIVFLSAGQGTHGLEVSDVLKGLLRNRAIA